jgi:hypothetical protein
MVVSLAGLIVMVSFLVEGGAVIDGRLPGPFPAALFWTGFGLGAVWWVWTEIRAARD